MVRAVSIVAVAIVFGGIGEAAPAAAQESPAAELLLVGGVRVDGTGGPAVQGGWIHVAGGRIAGVGGGAPPRVRGAQVIDLTGRTIMPGLSDMHAHLGSLPRARWMLKLFLAHGVTTVQDLANGLGNLSAIRGWAADQTAVPHLYVSGYILQGSYSEQRFLQPGDETERMVDDELAFGVDFIKTYNWTSTAALRQIVELASRRGVRVTGHTPLSATSVATIDAGVAILQHLRLRPYEVVDDLEVVARYPVDGPLMRRTGFWTHLDPNGRNLRQTLDAWEARKERFFVTPTLVVQEAVAHNYDYPDHDLMTDPAVALISAGLRKEWEEGSPPTYWGDLTPDEVAEAKASLEGMGAFVGLAHRRGVRILSGTDTAIPWLVPGASLHRELRHFVELAGLTPVEAIHTSTGAPARALAVEDRGTIAPGNVADLVIVRGDASQEIRAVSRVERVILGGRLFDRDALLEEAARLAREDRPNEEPSR